MSSKSAGDGQQRPPPKPTKTITGSPKADMHPRFGLLRTRHGRSKAHGAPPPAASASPQAAEAPPVATVADDATQQTVRRLHEAVYDLMVHMGEVLAAHAGDPRGWEGRGFPLFPHINTVAAQTRGVRPAVVPTLENVVELLGREPAEARHACQMRGSPASSSRLHGRLPSGGGAKVLGGFSDAEADGSALAGAASLQLRRSEPTAKEDAPTVPLESRVEGGGGVRGAPDESVANCNSRLPESPARAASMRVGYGTMLLGKVDAGYPCATLQAVLEQQAAACAACATAVECLQALHTLQQEGGLPAVAASPAAESGSPTVPDRLLMAACDLLFALWADFCHGTMQLLQGAVDVKEALHCSISQAFRDTACETFSVPTDDTAPGRDASVRPRLSQSALEADASTAGQMPERPDDSALSAPPMGCNDDRKAVIVPACLIKLGVLQLDTMSRVRSALDEGPCMSTLAGVDSFLRADRMRVQWLNAITAGLWDCALDAAGTTVLGSAELEQTDLPELQAFRLKPPQVPSSTCSVASSADSAQGLARDSQAEGSPVRVKTPVQAPASGAARQPSSEGWTAFLVSRQNSCGAHAAWLGWHMLRESQQLSELLEEPPLLGSREPHAEAALQDYITANDTDGYLTWCFHAAAQGERLSDRAFEKLSQVPVRTPRVCEHQDWLPHATVRGSPAGRGSAHKGTTPAYDAERVFLKRHGSFEAPPPSIVEPIECSEELPQMPVSRHSSGGTSSASIVPVGKLEATTLSIGGVSRQSSLQSLGVARPLSHEWPGGTDEVDASGRSAIGKPLGASGVMSGPRRPDGADAEASLAGGAVATGPNGPLAKNPSRFFVDFDVGAATDEGNAAAVAADQGSQPKAAADNKALPHVPPEQSRIAQASRGVRAKNSRSSSTHPATGAQKLAGYQMTSADTQAGLPGEEPGSGTARLDRQPGVPANSAKPALPAKLAATTVGLSSCVSCITVAPEVPPAGLQGSADGGSLQFQKDRLRGEGPAGRVWLCSAQGPQWTDVCGGMEHPRFALKEVTGRRALHANEPLADLAQQVIKSLPVRVHALQSLTEFYHRSIVKIFWADVVFLDPVTYEELPVSAAQLKRPAASPSAALLRLIGSSANSPTASDGENVCSIPPLFLQSTIVAGAAKSPPVNRPTHTNKKMSTDAMKEYLSPTTPQHRRTWQSTESPAAGYATTPADESSALIVAQQESADVPGSSPEAMPEIPTPEIPQHGGSASGADSTDQLPERIDSEAWESRLVRACSVAEAHATGVSGSADLDRNMAGADESGWVGVGDRGVLLQVRVAMEHCDLGSLYEYLAEPGAEPVGLSVSVAMHRCRKSVGTLRCVLLSGLEVAEALRSVHVCGIPHGDLKPQNVLFASDIEDERGFRAKVGDCGLAPHMAAPAGMPEGQQPALAYHPPQVFRDSDFTEASDVYSLGLVLWELYHGQRWSSIWNAERVHRRFSSASLLDFFRPRCSPDCPHAFSSLVYTCLHTDPSMRPSALEVCQGLRALLSSTPAEAGSDDASPGELAGVPIHKTGIGTADILRSLGNGVVNHQGMYTKVKLLGKGGVSVVHLCRLTEKGRHSGLGRGMPPVFALKTAASLQYHPGSTRAFRDCLRLGEPSLQRFLEHANVVAMYWAYVRCLDPDSGALLEMAAHDLALHVEGGPEAGGEDGTASIMQTMRSHGGRRRSGKWGLRSASQMSSGVAELGPWGVKLQMCIAMEHCDLGSLKDHLAKPGAKTRTLADAVTRARCGGSIDMLRCVLLTALDIAEAISFMHRNGVLHGDVKPHNVLLVTTPSDERRFRAKLCDFGLSVHLAPGQAGAEPSQGTEAYLPLEALQRVEITPATEVYSLGLVLWEIYYGILWFSAWDGERRRRKVSLAVDMQWYRPSCTDACPPPFADLVHDCIRSDPLKRPTAADVCRRLRESLAGPRPTPRTTAATEAPPAPHTSRSATPTPLAELSEPSTLSSSAGYVQVKAARPVRQRVLAARLCRCLAPDT